MRRRDDQTCLDWVTEMIRRKGEMIRRKGEKRRTRKRKAAFNPCACIKKRKH